MLAHKKYFVWKYLCKEWKILPKFWSFIRVVQLEWRRGKVGVSSFVFFSNYIVPNQDRLTHNYIIYSRWYFLRKIIPFFCSLRASSWSLWWSYPGWQNPRRSRLYRWTFLQWERSTLLPSLPSWNQKENRLLAPRIRPSIRFLGYKIRWLDKNCKRHRKELLKLWWICRSSWDWHFSLHCFSIVILIRQSHKASCLQWSSDSCCWGRHWWSWQHDWSFASCRYLQRPWSYYLLW